MRNDSDKDQRYRLVRSMPGMAKIIIDEFDSYEEAVDALRFQPIQDVSGDPSRAEEYYIEKIYKNKP